MNEDRYVPDSETLDSGVVIESYGRAHAQRQADAQAALDEINWAESAEALNVRCACKKHRRLAVVYRSSPVVIRIDANWHKDSDLRRLQRELASPPLARDDRVRYGEATFLDILHASSDRDLEARCTGCGRHTLDREAIIDAFAAGESELIVRVLRST